MVGIPNIDIDIIILQADIQGTPNARRENTERHDALMSFLKVTAV